MAVPNFEKYNYVEERLDEDALRHANEERFNFYKVARP